MADERGRGSEAHQGGQVEALREELRKAEEEIANLQQAQQQASVQADPTAGAGAKILPTVIAASLIA